MAERPVVNMNAALMLVNNWEEQQLGLRAVGVTEEGEGMGVVNRGKEELRSHGVFKIGVVVFF